MPTPATKNDLIETMLSRRAEFDALLARVPEGRLAEPGAAGEWSVKDILAHLNRYVRWLAERLHEQLRGESYAPTATDMMHFEERNRVYHEQDRHLPLADVLAEWHSAHEHLMAGVQAHSEAFLLQPQTFPGAPQPIVVADMLRSEVYDHYRQHVPSIEAWLADRG